MSKFNKYTFLIVFTALRFSECYKLSSVERSYNRGLEAYKGERWSKCIEHFEESLHLYKLYKSTIVNCRLECNSRSYGSQMEKIEDLKIYEHFFHKRNCLDTCQEKVFGGIHVHSESHNTVLFNMQARKPYEYLHVCYFQMYSLPKAASAAYTFLMAHPDDEVMKKNLKYYAEQPEVNINDVVDFENEDYEVLYRLGLKAYKHNQWGETIASMEEVLTDYISWENSCRAECEYQPEQEWSPEFVKTVSNYMASLLQCKQQCQDKLKTMNYKSGNDFLADVLNYLQISYYHLERLEDAAKAVASYLSLMPDDDDMLENKNIYSTLTDELSFVERSDIVHYYRRDSYEKKLLDIFHQGNDNNFNSNTIQ